MSRRELIHREWLAGLRCCPLCGCRMWWPEFEKLGEFHRAVGFEVSYRQRHKMRATFDHIVPKSQGGTYATSNGRVVCYHCNMKRGTVPLADNPSTDAAVEALKALAAASGADNTKRKVKEAMR